MVELFEAAGANIAQAKDARSGLKEMASAFLDAQVKGLDDKDKTRDVPLLVEAILEAETEGLSQQAESAKARAKLPHLVAHSIHQHVLFCFLIALILISFFLKIYFYFTQFIFR